MVWLLLVIILNVFILGIFRLLSHYVVNTYQTILVNYGTCALISIIISGASDFNNLNNVESWGWIAFFLGGLFVGTFYLIARTAQMHSVSVASIASKISLVIPVAFSFFVLKSFSHSFDAFNYAGLLLTVVSIVLSGLSGGGLGLKGKGLILPVGVFLLTGVIDSAINFANLRLIQPDEHIQFTGVLFISAAIFGTAPVFIKKQVIDKGSLKWGVVLGVINLFSVLCLLKALNAYNNDGSFIFPVINIGIVLVATLVSIFHFRDRMSRFQIASFILGLLSLIFIAHQELLGF